jgi:hypothetical protein
MGGDIRLRSELGKGTEISFEIPVTSSKKSSPATPGKPDTDSITWSILARNDNDNRHQDRVPMEKLAVFTRNSLTKEVLSKMFTLVGISIVGNDSSVYASFPVGFQKIWCRNGNCRKPIRSIVRKNGLPVFSDGICTHASSADRQLRSQS